MAAITTEIDALYAAGRRRPDASALKALRHDGQLAGWTFRTGDGYGWVLTDGRVSPSLEPYRSYAADDANLNLTGPAPRRWAGSARPPRHRPQQLGDPSP
ncbi:hypothetical protein AB0D10_01250 [Kitasatospora sp. NPDC048545]|uniref:hypothetical protein n=1 Tax=Kitasatospora sp. NPDC048545 TaxID=3157208 RepID=UPI0033C06495